MPACTDYSSSRPVTGGEGGRGGGERGRVKEGGGKGGRREGGKGGRER